MGILDPPLAHAEPARGGPFRVAGQGAAVLGDLRAGITASATRGGLLTGPVRLAGTPPAVAANVLQAPGLLRRELVLGGRTVLETVVVPRRLAGFAVQWEWAGSGAEPLAVDVVLLPTGGALPTWEGQGGSLRLQGPLDSSGLILHMSPFGSWSVSHASEGLRVRGQWHRTDGPCTLLVAPLDAQGRGPALAALAGLDAHRRQAARAGLDTPGIRLETGVVELDQGVAWARALLEAAAGPAAPPPDPAPDPRDPAHPASEVLALLLEPAARPAWTALGALAAGDFPLARTLLPPTEQHPLALLARAEWVAWTGDEGPFLSVRQELTGALAGVSSGTGPAAALGTLLRHRLAAAAEAVGHGGWAAELRAEGSPSATPGARRLPTLPRRPLPGAFLEAVLGDGTADVPPGDDLSPNAALLMSRALYASGHPDRALPALRQALGTPVREGPALSPLTPALVLHVLMGGLLGARPDAAAGRLRLAPALPAAWTRFAARGLAFGDATLDVAFIREGGRHTWRFTPTGGSVPPMLVLEPSFPLARVAAVELDGQPVELDVKPHGDRTVLRLQLPLDSERSLSVDGS